MLLWLCTVLLCRNSDVAVAAAAGARVYWPCEVAVTAAVTAPAITAHHFMGFSSLACSWCLK